MPSLFFLSNFSDLFKLLLNYKRQAQYGRFFGNLQRFHEIFLWIFWLLFWDFWVFDILTHVALFTAAVKQSRVPFACSVDRAAKEASRECSWLWAVGSSAAISRWLRNHIQWKKHIFVKRYKKYIPWEHFFLSRT